MIYITMGPDDSRIQNIDHNNQADLTAHDFPSSPRGFGSIARLLIGGVLLGIDELNASLGNWGAEISSPKSGNADFPSSQSSKSEEFDIPSNTSISQSDEYDNSNIVRYALIGLAFDIQERVQSGLKIVDQTTRSISNVATPIIDPISNSRLVKPFRRRYDELVLRGKQEVDRWVDAGLAEDTRSRQFAQTALEKSVDKSIDYLTTNEEIKELIETQSVSLAGEVVEEIRERAVSADILLERIVRMLLRLTPRTELPAPPTEVMEQARPFIRRAGRVVRKT
jgi:hypothetical protein